MFAEITTGRLVIAVRQLTERQMQVRQAVDALTTITHSSLMIGADDHAFLRGLRETIASLEEHSGHCARVEREVIDGANAKVG